MDKQFFLLLTSLAQWGIFVAIVLIIYGKVENKSLVKRMGQGMFVFLGIYALCILVNGVIEIPPYVDIGNVTAEAKTKALVSFIGLAMTGLIGAISLLFSLVNKHKISRIATIILLIFGLLLFFMIYNLQKM
ncbi:MAG: hypothetical protein ACK5MI_07570 [Mangrovibacterium sp.]